MSPPTTVVPPATLAAHNAAVKSVSSQISAFHRTSTPFRIYHASTNSTRPSTRTASASLDISQMNAVLAVSPETKTCIVEPNVPMDALLRATVAHGLMPPVVPEFPGITVGGAFAGTAGESSSFKYGFFDRTVTWIEMVLADGEVVTASADERADLFEGARGTFGSLGVATAFEITLIPAAQFVELTYLSVTDVEDARSVMMQQGAEPVDFIDGIMFAPNSGVVLVGRLVESPSSSPKAPLVTFTKAWDQWFYLHVEQRLKALTATSSVSAVRADLIPLADYLFRYDRGAFWTGVYAYTYFITPFTRLTRYLLDGFMHTRVMYHALHRSGMMSQFIIQDMALPGPNMRAFSDWLDRETPTIYPRWLCPLKQGEDVSMNPHRRNDDTATSPEKPTGIEPTATTSEKKSLIGPDSLLNVGLWGPTPPGKEHLSLNRTIEAKLASLGGMKWLYAQTFYTPDEFWAIYDRRWYDALRAKYRATGLPSVYDKVGTSVDASGQVKGAPRGIWRVWPLAGLWGVGSVLKGGDYLRKG